MSVRRDPRTELAIPEAHQASRWADDPHLRQAERQHTRGSRSGGAEAHRANREGPRLRVHEAKEAPDLRTFIEEIRWPKYELGGGKRGKNSETTLEEKRHPHRAAHRPAPGPSGPGAGQPRGGDEVLRRAEDGGLPPQGAAGIVRGTHCHQEAAVAREEGQGPAEGIGREVDPEHPGDPSHDPRRSGEVGLSEGAPRASRRGGAGSRVRLVSAGPGCPAAPAARIPWERTLLMFALHTGARMGEQRALRWTDVDFQLRRVYIRRSAPGSSKVVKAPKSNRLRWVDLTPELMDALKAIRHGGELVFCQENGSMLLPGHFHEALWAAQRRAVLRRIKWHELRHSYASMKFPRFRGHPGKRDTAPRSDRWQDGNDGSSPRNSRPTRFVS